MASKEVTAKSAGRPKSIEKRQQILRAATELMLAEGYTKTSMDAVAKASGVSKQTVYSHFNNKESLYNALIEEKCIAYQIEKNSVCVNSQPLEPILTDIGERFIHLLLDENVVSMYKVVIGESKQDSNVAQLFYEAGPLHSVKLVQQLLIKHPQSLLCPDVAKEVACDFFNLLKSDFHMRSILHLPFELNESQQSELASKTAKKCMAIIAYLKSASSSANMTKI